ELHGVGLYYPLDSRVRPDGGADRSLARIEIGIHRHHHRLFVFWRVSAAGETVLEIARHRWLGIERNRHCARRRPAAVTVITRVQGSDDVFIEMVLGRILVAE